MKWFLGVSTELLHIMMALGRAITQARGELCRSRLLPLTVTLFHTRMMAGRAVLLKISLSCARLVAMARPRSPLFGIAE